MLSCVIFYEIVTGVLSPCFISDLALRNCLLTADISVKIGDYGLAHTKYKVDQPNTVDVFNFPEEAVCRQGILVLLV